ncbi:MAG: FAD-binding oxidoreductase [Actinobacteria bacterium]|nr:FAD-binding oxidoreductase [Actinomycetota bacterium]
MNSLAASPTRLCPNLTVVIPENTGYEEARRAWNLHADLRPAAIVAARDEAEVGEAVRLARAHGLQLVPFTTGHLATALPDLSRAILLRLEFGRAVEVDPPTRRARIPAGALWEEVVEAVAPHGLAVAHGSSPDVGAIGYLLGGGLSFYARRHGLAADQVVSFELVDADGALRRVDADSHPDLFWALRGGGGSFGVVTAVEIDLLPYAEVFGGAVFWRIEDAAAVLHDWAAWTRTAPDSVTTSARLLRLPPIPDVPEPLRAVPVLCVDGVAVEEADGRALVDRLGAVAEPLLGGWETMPSAAVLRIHGDPEQPVPAISEHALLGELDEQALAALLEVAGEGADCPLLFAELRQLGGALATPPADAGARAGLLGRFALFAVGMPMSPADQRPIEASLAGLLDRLAPWDTGRRYLNFAERDLGARAGFDPATHARLTRIREEWDPGRRFLAAHPIAPAG